MTPSRKCVPACGPGVAQWWVYDQYCLHVSRALTAIPLTRDGYPNTVRARKRPKRVGHARGRGLEVERRGGGQKSEYPVITLARGLGLRALALGPPAPRSVRLPGSLPPLAPLESVVGVIYVKVKTVPSHNDQCQ